MQIKYLLLFATAWCLKMLVYAQKDHHLENRFAFQSTGVLLSALTLQPVQHGARQSSIGFKTVAALGQDADVDPESELADSSQCILPSTASNRKVKRESPGATNPSMLETDQGAKDNLDAKNFNLAIGFGVFGVVSCICTIIGTIAAIKWRKSSSAAKRNDTERDTTAASSRAASLGPQYGYSRVEERWIRIEDGC